jgi:15-cis-phytoene synthase
MMVAFRSLISDLASPTSAASQIMSTHAKTFRFASRFLPVEYRDPTVRLYSFFRTLDDLVDESPDEDLVRACVRQEIDDWTVWFQQDCAGLAPRSEIGDHVAQIKRDFGIPASIFLDFLDGLRSDLTPVTPENVREVEHYSYKVASTVGLSMAHVFGATTPQAKDAATSLGIAMQLTNILRDVGGDLQRKRIYIPQTLLDEFQLDPQGLIQLWQAGNGPDDRFRGVVQSMIHRADEHYRAGIEGVRLLPADVQLPILVAARLYRQILRELEANDLDSLRKRVSTSRFQKLAETFRCISEVEPVGEAQFEVRQLNIQNPERSESGVDAR